MSEALIKSQLDALRQCGTSLQKPIEFFHIEKLADRARRQPEPVKLRLESRVLELIRALDPVPGVAANVVHIGSSPLRALVQDIHYRDAQPTSNRSLDDKRPLQELKSVRDYRGAWSKLSIDRKVKVSLQQVPPNAGPINSHMVALRSLELMRDIAPDYLSRFVTYLDALVCLEGQTSPGKISRAR